MKTHGEIDERSLALARAVVAKIEADPTRAGISMARETCRRWRKRQQLPIVSEWIHILEKPHKGAALRGPVVASVLYRRAGSPNAKTRIE